MGHGGGSRLGVGGWGLRDGSDVVPGSWCLVGRDRGGISAILGILGMGFGGGGGREFLVFGSWFLVRDGGNSGFRGDRGRLVCGFAAGGEFLEFLSLGGAGG